MPALQCLVLMMIIACPLCAVGQVPPGATDFNATDRLAIQNVIASNFLNLDSFQIDKWMANFTPEASFVAEVGTTRYEWDRAGFENFFRSRFTGFKRESKQRRHIVSNILFVEQSNESARIVANGLLLSTAHGGPAELVGSLTYEGAFVKQDGVWRIARWIVRGDTDMTLEDVGDAKVTDLNKD